MNETSLAEQSSAQPDAEIAKMIAQDTHVAVDLVQQVYRQELVELARNARITQFLSVLASRRARLRLREH